jgi:hypothetical protein
MLRRFMMPSSSTTISSSKYRRSADVIGLGAGTLRPVGTGGDESTRLSASAASEAVSSASSARRRPSTGRPGGGVSDARVGAVAGRARSCSRCWSAMTPAPSSHEPWPSGQE